MHYAHSTQAADRSDWQVLIDHLREVARLAAARGDKFGGAKAAALAGWLHDLGKYAQAFQLYSALYRRQGTERGSFHRRRHPGRTYATLERRKLFSLGGW